ncbi:FHA domain-containing protein [Sediminihabitans luteus]|uniref:FHA domain-containing protein n=1 Tax=Sediminihabitans luteus TaxID=1138585 RepID=A0A2M9CZR7_9CELL|nr:FHA domain-containing protein [Sediminihabitans luteus]PJJ77315.1 FHA domain-containing protein [Sediminihabitans luteus]GII98766.1 hypothetical protein Slu03_11440 [Sediminihabitans luteus]
MLRYDDGDGCALVTERAVVLLAERPVQTLTDALWQALTADAGVLDLLQVLTGTGGLRDLPSFAIVVDDGAGTHVAVRGDVDVRLVGAAGRVEVDGRGVMTWAERTVDGVVEFDVVASAIPGSRSYPLVAGVVAAGRVRRGTQVVSGSEAPTSEVEAPSPSSASPSSASSPSAPASALAPGAVLGVPASFAEPQATADVSSGDAFSDAASESTPSDVAPDAVAPSDDAPGAGVPAGDASSDEPPAADAPADTAPGTDVSSDDAPSDHAPSDEALDEVGASDGEPVEAAPVEEPEIDGYTHLWGRTVASTVEAAAVRPLEEDEDAQDADAQDRDAAGHGAAPGPVPSPAGDAAPDPVVLETMVPEATVPPTRPLSEGMISGIPRELSTPGPVHAAAVPSPPSPSPAGGPAGRPAAPPPPTDDELEAHTVHSSAIASLRVAAQAASAASGPAPAPGPSGPMVLARVCACGRTNPPQYERCVACGASLEADAVQVPRPSLGTVRVSDGRTVDLDRPLVVGRRPRSTTAASSDLPRLVTVASPQQDISRSHVEVRIEGWHVLVNDLDTTNGTVLRREGAAPRRLHPHLPELVSAGDVIDLGDDVTLTFDDLL